ncbi:Heat shock 70 kDa protein 12A [Podila horticola]|nr:Heat shock 70 kDa protein 12A [Podila horticola]
MTKIDRPDNISCYTKTPTINLYEETTDGLKLVAWGWSSRLKEMEPSKSKYTPLYKYKPYLDENISLSPWEGQISVPEAISDYLKVFHDYAAETIEQEIGRRFTRENFRYCLTVPAMWSDKAKDIMRQAAIRSGLIKEDDHPDRLMLVSEPEAAALYCERSCKEYNLKHDDRFLICDAGGGTVDLIVYDVTVSSEGRTLSEVTKGHGATCGSMLIDMNFGNLLIDKFKRQGATIPDDIIPKLVETFAYELKPRFDGDKDLIFGLPWNKFFAEIKRPGAIGIDEDKMTFKASELRKIVFDPVVTQVLQLIREQLDKAKNCSAIFMVGGFGSSKYLLNRVKQEFGGKVQTISAPHRAERAVVFGAVYAGLNPRKVTARATRRCYGIGVLSPFEWGVDPPKLVVYRAEGIMCEDRFSTFVKKGQLVKVDECVTRSYNLTHQGGADRVNYNVPIFVVDGDPPRYVTDLRESAHISIPDPFTSLDPPGRKLTCRLSFYFGLNEIQVEASVQEKTYITRLQFDNGGSANLPRRILFHDTREH